MFRYILERFKGYNQLVVIGVMFTFLFPQPYTTHTHSQNKTQQNLTRET